LAKQKVGYKELFKEKNYMLIWFGQSMSNIGDMVYHVGFLWLVYKITQSPFIASMLILSSTAPYILFGLIGGAYSDRINRKQIMMVSDILRAVFVLIIPILIAFEMLNVWFIGIVSFLLTSIRCFFYPALRATIPQILSKDKWSVGNAMLQMSFQLSRVMGYSIGGLLIAELSISTVFYVNVGTYILSFITLIPLHLREQSISQNRLKILEEIIETMKFVRTVPALFWSIMMFGVGLLAITGVQRLALPVMSDQFWQLESKGLGYLLAAFGIGNVIGSFIIGKLSIRSFEKFIFLGWAMWGLSFVIVGISELFVVAAVFGFLAGISEAVIDVPQVLLIQHHVTNERLGKVFSMWSTIAFIGESGSSLLAGLLIGILGEQMSFIIGSVLLMFIGCIGLGIHFLYQRKVPVVKGDSY